MQEQGALLEVDYFRKLAASKKLSDAKKLDESLVYTYFFKQLASYDSQKKNNILGQLAGQEDVDDYPVCRLLFKALLCTGVEVNNEQGEELLQKVLMRNDVPLLREILKHTIDLNKKDWSGISPLAYCNSLETAELMVEEGAEVAKASWGMKDLVCKVCYCNNNTDLLRFYLPHIEKSKSNQFGKGWMDTISTLLGPDFFASNSDVAIIIDHISVLLEYECAYDEGQKDAICKGVAEKSPELKGQIERLFLDHEGGGTGVKSARR